ncbi:TetR-like C-terminal domain-containing protein [Nesterenkonia alkaliphila]|uniref:TetR-like C-terminal domain-containing protein n=1 Tax=Nesterenkonia alkaliphila TaxID=1463631 RepID=UPI0012F9D06A|nr:TetR-like C-terminal domain-containing protein [Nesterenkonia alkaliphila]GFZ78291.1 hypothetical protein GCM10011359_03160 [Nesterenkonia alkaliphila]
MLASLGGEAAHDAELAEVLRASILDGTARQLAEIYRRAMNRGELADSPNAEAAAQLLIGVILSGAAFRAPGAPLLGSREQALVLEALGASLRD